MSSTAGICWWEHRRTRSIHSACANCAPLAGRCCAAVGLLVELAESAFTSASTGCCRLAMSRRSQQCPSRSPAALPLSSPTSSSRFQRSARTAKARRGTNADEWIVARRVGFPSRLCAAQLSAPQRARRGHGMDTRTRVMDHTTTRKYHRVTTLRRKSRSMKPTTAHTSSPHPPPPPSCHTPPM